ncbi:MAG: ABC transporter permease [Planctomycetes bacterium]|nr:ABC transporter permease [Planctomycetota bacterium]
MIRYLELASLRWLLRHRWQLAAAVLGVALGLACVVGVELASRSALASFERSTRALAGRATHSISAGPDGVDERDYSALVRAFPTLDFAPILERDVRLKASESLPLVLTGVDANAELRLRADSLPTLPLDEHATDPRAVWLARATAERAGLAAGAQIELLIDGRTVPATLAGLLDAHDPGAAAALGGRLFADLATVQTLTGSTGRLSRIDVRVEDAATRERLIAALPPNAVLDAVDARAGELERMSRAMRFNLRALALLALFVGAFLVYDTSTFSVVQRRELFGRMRALGADRSTLFATVAHEALWVGLAGSSLGLVLGIAVAHALVAPLARTLTDLYTPVGVVELDLSPTFLASAAALGVVATLVGALLPALEAAASPARQAMARSFLEDRARRLVRPLAWTAFGLALAAVALLALSRTSVLAALVAVFAVFAAAGCIAPLVTSLASRGAAKLATRLGGSLERIAARSVEAALSRTAVAVAALSVALGTSLAMGAMVSSFRGTLERWLGRTLSADVYVSAPHPTASRSDGALDPALIDALTHLEGVEAVAANRGVELRSGDDAWFLNAVAGPERERASYRLLEGEPESAWKNLEGDEIFVSEAFARSRGLGVGGVLAVPTAHGKVDARIAAVFQDYATDRGYVLVARPTYDRWFADRSISGVGLYLAEGVDPEATVARIRDELAPDRAIGVRSNASLREATFTIFDRTFAVARALELFATLVAALACLSSLAALEFERARELALLRAEGLGPVGVVRLVLGRSTLVGVIAAALALPVGLALAALLVFEMQPRAFGWTLEWSVDGFAIARIALLAVAAAFVAGIVPAWSALRSSPARALAEE